MLFLGRAGLICGAEEGFSRVVFPYYGIAVHLAGQEFQIKQITQAHAELWLVLEAFSAFRRTRILQDRGLWLFLLCLLSLLSLCAVDSGHSSGPFMAQIMALQLR